MATTKQKPKSPKRATKKKRAARPKASAARDVSMASALAQAAWTEADAALAQALVELDALENAANAGARASALALLSQALTRAGRKRGLTRIGVVGAAEAYDPARHELSASVARKPKSVIIEARGVARGGDVLAKPRVAPVSRTVRRTKKRI